MFDNDNNLLLIILICIIIFIIINMNYNKKELYTNQINTKTNENYSNTLKSNINNSIKNSINSLNSNIKESVNSINSNIKDSVKSRNDNNNLMSINHDNYMLIDPSIPNEPKFDKVIPKNNRKTLSSSELLPVEENDKWFQNPNSKFNLMEAVNLEIPEIKIGIDTVGQSRKNATYDLRSAPPNPKFVVSPWSNSTIEPDYNTKPLC